MLFRPVLTVALVVSCQARPDSEPAPTRAGLEVRDAHGQLTTRLVPGRPCRATIEGVELQVGADPLVAMVGAVRWSGEDDPASGTTLLRDGTRTARIFPSAPSSSLELFDAEGIAMIRARLSGDEASVVDRSGVIVRTARRTKAGVSVGELTVNGTQDLLLAALISAPEVRPEVRALAACQRLFARNQAL